jgi:hypothetical protein
MSTGSISTIQPVVAVQVGSEVEGLQDPEGQTHRLLHIGEDHHPRLSRQDI